MFTLTIATTITSLNTAVNTRNTCHNLTIILNIIYHDYAPVKCLNRMKALHVEFIIFQYFNSDLQVRYYLALNLKQSTLDNCFNIQREIFI